MTGDRQRVLLLSGGVGGAKLAHGYALLDDRVDLTVVVNTGDDFEHLGLSISPDIDTVLYTLGGIANQSQGWGIEGESWRTLDRLRELGGEDWFRLGDLDIATHLYRTAALASGRRLTEIVLELAERLGVRARVLPASDDKVRTRLHTDEGELAFQNYFVRQACRPRVRSISIAGAEHASLTPELTRVLGSVGEPLDAVILAPSNPFLSLAPILAIPQLSDLLRGACGRIVAVSPIIAGGQGAGSEADERTGARRVRKRLGKVSCRPLRGAGG